MLLASRLLRVVLLGRLLGGGRRRGYGYGYGRRRRGRARFIGPFPTYTTRTRRGGRVTVGGCCLPIPLAIGLTSVFGAHRLIRRR